MTCHGRIGSGLRAGSAYLEKPLRSKEQVEVERELKAVLRMVEAEQRKLGPHLGIDIADQSEACRQERIYAQCSPCGYYSTDPRSITCCSGHCLDPTGKSCNALPCPNCGRLHSWTGSFTRPAEMSCYEPPDPELRPLWQRLRRLWRR